MLLSKRCRGIIVIIQCNFRTDMVRNVMWQCMEVQESDMMAGTYLEFRAWWLIFIRSMDQLSLRRRKRRMKMRLWESKRRMQSCWRIRERESMTPQLSRIWVTGRYCDQEIEMVCVVKGLQWLASCENEKEWR